MKKSKKQFIDMLVLKPFWEGSTFVDRLEAGCLAQRRFGGMGASQRPSPPKALDPCLGRLELGQVAAGQGESFDCGVQGLQDPTC